MIQSAVVAIHPKHIRSWVGNGKLAWNRDFVCLFNGFISVWYNSAQSSAFFSVSAGGAGGHSSLPAGVPGTSPKIPLFYTPSKTAPERHLSSFKGGKHKRHV